MELWIGVVDVRVKRDRVFGSVNLKEPRVGDIGVIMEAGPGRLDTEEILL